MKRLPIIFVATLLIACSPEATTEEDFIEKEQKHNASIIDSISKKTIQDQKSIDKKSTQGSESLQAELLIFIQSLEVISQEVSKNQKAINEKMQQANSREDDDEVANMTISLLSQQQQALKGIPLTTPKLLNIRNKLIEATEINIQASSEMIQLREPNSENEQALIDQFNNAQKLSEEARLELKEQVTLLKLE